MKGFVEETIWIITLVLAMAILSIFFIFQQGTGGVDVRKTVEERVLNEEGISSIFSTFNDKLPYAEKTYLETAVDAVLQGAFNNEDLFQVYYGTGIGKLNVTEIVPPLFDNYLKGRWRLEIVTPDGNYAYGKQDLGNVVYTYRSIVPVPEERTGEVILYIG